MGRVFVAGSINMDVVATADRHPLVGETVAGNAVLYFPGAYVYSYVSNPGKSWHDHFEFARAASTFKIQRLGNEAGLPTLTDIEVVKMAFAASS